MDFVTPHAQARASAYRRSVPLPPTHAVAVVVREIMMEIVIALTEGEERDDWIVARRVAVGVRP